MRSHDFSRYNASQHYRSPYLYPDCDVMINLSEIRDPEELSHFEEEMTDMRQLILEQELPIKGRFSAAHLMRIHHYIFQDVYPFAGKLRIEDIEKDQTRFTLCHLIREQLTDLLNQLKSENFLRSIDRSTFCSRIAYYMIELNMIHPFREGNGRSIRMFLRQLSIQRGYEIDWAKADRIELMNAMIAGVVKDYATLAALIDRLIEGGSAS